LELQSAKRNENVILVLSICCLFAVTLVFVVHVCSVSDNVKVCSTVTSIMAIIQQEGW